MRMGGAVESDDVYVTAGLKGVAAGESGGLGGSRINENRVSLLSFY
jgi:hypothetical protein